LRRAMNSHRVTYSQRPDATPESEVFALAAIYHLCLFGSQAKKGGLYDLTSDSTEECTTRLDQKGKENADLHGNRL
jgi:hypothetical protein